MTYEDAVHTLRNHPHITFAYAPHMDMYMLTAGDQSRYYPVEKLAKMKEADLMYEAVHLIRLAHLETEEPVTRMH